MKAPGKRPYQGILLDMDNTLLDFDSGERRAFLQTCTQFGLDAGEKEYQLFHQVNDYLWKQLEQGRVDKPTLRIRRFQVMLELMGRTGDVSPAYFHECYTQRMGQEHQLLPGAEEFCKWLKQMGYKTAVVTNGHQENQHRRLRESGLAAYMDAVVVSEECAPKPDPIIFQLAAQRLQLEPSQVVVLGDSLGADIAGGQRAGMDTIWLAEKETPLPQGIEPTYRIHCLEEAKELL
ncbi:MAG: YjjG family noncanonical pyrimidine nucleotidase [Eubacteriales bacterium]|jgi:2-haloacid dehalogenase